MLLLLLQLLLLLSVNYVHLGINKQTKHTTVSIVNPAFVSLIAFKLYMVPNTFAKFRASVRNSENRDIDREA
jgi:uncharacterized membrane protein YesL